MATPAVRIDPEIMHGVPCFAGTRVPVKHLFEFIEAGQTLDEFLRQFPSVRREQATEVLETAREQLESFIRGAALGTDAGASKAAASDGTQRSRNAQAPGRYEYSNRRGKDEAADKPHDQIGQPLVWSRNGEGPRQPKSAYEQAKDCEQQDDAIEKLCYEVIAAHAEPAHAADGMGCVEGNFIMTGLATHLPQ